MNWWPFAKEAPTLDGPHTLLADIEKRGRRYLDDVDDGKLISPACKRTLSDAGCDQVVIADHTRLEAFRYLLMVPRREFTLLAEPERQAVLLDGYLRQLPHEETVVEFTGVTDADLAIAIVAGFNWLVQCAVLAGADPKEFYGALRNFRRVVSAAQKWWASDGAQERYGGMLKSGEEPPLFLNLVWSAYGRMAAEIAAAHARR
jgi:hypothetical protein